MIGLDNIWGKPGMIFGFRKDTDGKETISTILHYPAAPRHDRRQMSGATAPMAANTESTASRQRSWINLYASAIINLTICCILILFSPANLFISQFWGQALWHTATQPCNI